MRRAVLHNVEEDRRERTNWVSRSTRAIFTQSPARSSGRETSRFSISIQPATKPLRFVLKGPHMPTCTKPQSLSLMASYSTRKSLRVRRSCCENGRARASWSAVGLLVRVRACCARGWRAGRCERGNCGERCGTCRSRWDDPPTWMRWWKGGLSCHTMQKKNLTNGDFVL